MRNVGLLLFLITFLLTANKGWSQQVLKGEIVDEMDAGIPFAKIYVKNSGLTGTGYNSDHISY
jgi:hypothetical protein